jgi:hypothetical protein
MILAKSREDTSSVSVQPSKLLELSLADVIVFVPFLRLSDHFPKVNSPITKDGQATGAVV